MTETVECHHKNLNPDECRAVFDDWLGEQCKDFVNSSNARFQMKMYTGGIMMAVKQ